MARAGAAAPATAEAPSPCNDGSQGGMERDVCEERQGFGEITVVIVPWHCSYRV